MQRQLNTAALALALTGLMAGSAAVLFWLGRVPWCECGYIKLWHGDIFSSENSQHILDWYSPSHLVHGVLSYAVLALVARNLPLGHRAIIAFVIEEGWEIAENTEAMIDRYRETTVSLGYYGDSIVNSVADATCMLIGFGLAARLPVWASVALVLLLEISVGLIIRDNLTLNVIMLVYPFEAIKTWQLGS